MDVPSKPDALLPPALLAKAKTKAAADNRPVVDVIHEAVERYLADRPAPLSGTAVAPRSRAQAAARMLERRHLHRLPEGETIKDLMTYGRA